MDGIASLVRCLHCEASASPPDSALGCTHESPGDTAESLASVFIGHLPPTRATTSDAAYRALELSSVSRHDSHGIHHTSSSVVWRRRDRVIL